MHVTTNVSNILRTNPKKVAIAISEIRKINVCVSGVCVDQVGESNKQRIK